MTDAWSVEWPGGDTFAVPVDPCAASGTLADALARLGRPLNTRCGKRRLCSGCLVELAAGSCRVGEAVVQAPAKIEACAARLAPDGSAEVRVPLRSVAAHAPQVGSSFKVSVTAAHDPLIEIGGAGDHALAIDIGTTTVVVALVDLRTGAVVADESGFNRQIELGDNVVTRIHLAADGERRRALQQAIVARTLVPLIRALMRRSGIASTRLAGAVVAGNTTMLHLLVGADPSGMGAAPFRPVFTEHRVFDAVELGLGAVMPAGPVHLLAGVSAYVGADIIAGCLCTGMLNEPQATLLVDLGTNGEVVLHHDGRLWATATAAGPAFEGGSLSCGIRAVVGAIEGIGFREEPLRPQVEVIGNAPRVAGVCGSAYVDFLAEGRRIGLLNGAGRFTERWDELAPGYRAEEERKGRSVLVRFNDSASGVSETDVAHLLQAKAAIAAGILTLLRRAGLSAREVGRVYLAGGFGLHLDVRQAIACGLLPGFLPEQVEVVGNTSLGGAWLALVDRGTLDEMQTAIERAGLIELNRDPAFEDTYIDQLCLPQPSTSTA